MKNNYQNFTSHPTDKTDPRISAWRSTLQWLEEKYLQEPRQPLSIKFLKELNCRCGVNDRDAVEYEKETWGVNYDGVPSADPGFRQGGNWMHNGNPRIGSREEIGLLEEIREKLKNNEITHDNYKQKFTTKHIKLLEQYYHELTRPEAILSEVQNLVDLANSEDFRKMHPVQRAAILGLRLVRIHPFDGANGRTQQLLMGLELMREGYPPLVRRDMGSFYEYLKHDIRNFEPNCEVFTRWCAVNVAIVMMSSDASNAQLRSYADKLFVKNMPFEEQWSNGHSSLAPPAELNASATSAPDSEPANNYNKFWLHAHSLRGATGHVGDPNALPLGAKDWLTVEEIDELAKTNSILHGKWILEVSEERINAVWQHIAKAISSGALPRSPSAKSSTAAGFGVPPNFHAHYVICVYTNNYLDVDDVMGAAADLKSSLARANLTKDIGVVHYKPDIYTHLGFYGGPNDRVEEWRYKYSFA
eukprot:Phypoly_transcript_00394.p1 GENE.Phypoly_transcript_00394~~Phypoly_transcript_00394.p1  ORF type:complete len:473 (+),score=74.89 Phypoly_transcript_00394:3504-4922(+)